MDHTESAEPSSSPDDQPRPPYVARQVKTTMESPIRKPVTNQFYGLFGLAQIFGLLSVVLTIVWVSQYLNGFDWSKPATRFNYHPLFMVLGFIYLGGNAMLVYRVLKNERKPVLKLLHAALNGLALLFAIVGSIAVFSFHNEANIPNLYSLHSWVGLGVLILFAGQLVGGTVTYLFPGMPGPFRAMVLPIHVYGGTAIFSLSVVAVISGITEKAFFSLTKDTGKPYASLPADAYVLNLLGIMVILFAITVGYMVNRTEYKRQPLPEEQQLQMQMEETTVN